jgi:hypothetical protein
VALVQVTAIAFGNPEHSAGARCMRFEKTLGVQLAIMAALFEQTLYIPRA